MRIFRWCLFALLLVLTVGACDGDGPSAPKPTATSIDVVGGHGQNGIAGQQLPQPLVFQIADQFGAPLAGVPVTVQVTGGGSVTGGTAFQSDQQGRVTFTWTLGTAAGEQSVRAAIQGDTALATATATAGPLTALQAYRGNNQADTVGQVLPAPVGVRAVDAAGNPIAGVSVTFVVTSGGGSVFLGSTITNAEGVALEQWRLGTSTSVAQQLEARAIDPASGQPLSASFGATALPASPAELIVETTARVDTVGQTMPEPAAVQVRDVYGNPVPGAVVSWTPLTGGSVSAAQAVANASGVASVAWTLGTNAGEHRLQASIPADADTLIASALAGAPVSIERVSGDDQSGTVAQALPQPISVRVTDEYGNPVPGYTIQFILPPNSSIPTPGPNTGSDGVATATWVLGTTAGVQNAVAHIGSDSTTFRANAAPGPVASLTITPDSTVLTHVGDTAQMTAVAHDAYGNAVPNAVITWSSVEPAVASVSNSGLVTAQAQGVVGIRATSTSNGQSDVALASVPIIGTERVLDVPGLGFPDSYQLVGDYFIYRQRRTSNSFDVILRRISTMEAVWQRVVGNGVIALGERYAAISDGFGGISTFDTQTGTISQVNESNGVYRGVTSDDWVAYEVWSGSGRQVTPLGIRMQNIATRETRVVSASGQAFLGGRQCAGRPLFDYPYLAYVDNSGIMVFNAETSTTTAIGPGNPFDLTMGGTRVSWMPGDGVRVHDLSTGTTTTLSAGTCATLDENLLVWTLGNVYQHNLDTGERLRVTYTAGGEGPASGDQRRVLFLSNSSGALRFHLFTPH